MDNLKDLKVLVLGLGSSGRSAAHFLLQKGASVSGVDDHLPDLMEKQLLQDLIEKGLKTDIDLQKELPQLVILSPGVPPTHPCLVLAEKHHIEVIGEIELACRFIKNPMAAITGTNGKTSVTLLVTHVLKQVGIAARSLGNIGEPLSAVLNDNDTTSHLVVELSSFQLETLHAPCFEVAVILNITPDHLDRYASFEEYAQAKERLLHCLKPDSQFYVNESCAILAADHVRKFGYEQTNAVCTDGEYVYFNSDIVFHLPKEMQGRRSHEVENLMAAFALCQKFGVNGEQFLEAYQSFEKPPHRIEFVRVHEEVTYINDSKGTNIDAVVKAVTATQTPIVLIVGGVDKGSSYQCWLQAFDGKVRQLILIGQAAPKIKTELGEFLPTQVCKDLNEALQAAKAVAKAGDTVLLSPGCASYDMFKDYAHRGDEFKRLVHAL